MQWNLQRRMLLTGLAGLPVAGCSNLARPLCPTDPTISDPRTPLTIDVHAHIFNGRDLQIKEFISQVVFEDKGSELHGLAVAMGKVLQGLAWQWAPSAKEEMTVMASYGSSTADCRAADAMKRSAASAFQSGYARGREQLQSAAALAARSTEGAAVLSPGRAGPGLGAAIEGLPPTYEEFEQRRVDQVSVLGGQPHLLGYLNFVLHHFNYRYVNAIDYLTTYSKDSPRKVDLLVASMVDYDWWLARGNPTDTTLDEQVHVMAQVAVITGGRVHGFVPFCPFREAMTRTADGVGDSLRLVQRAIESHGFIGVKLYPPMGFAPWSNDGLDLWKGKPTLVRAAWEPDFGRRLDAALRGLYEWCLTNDVPIMAHANPSNSPYADFRPLAGSEYWRRALEAFPGLKVSFGHFGDTSIEDHDGENSSPLVALMSTASGTSGTRVYADSGYFAGALLNPIAMAKVLGRLYAQSPDGVLRERLMYGTDWTMILPQQNVESYLRQFMNVQSRVEAQDPVARPGGATLADAFFGRNAVRFLGLQRGSPTRRRLEAFYERHQMGEPDWMMKIGL